MFKKAFSFFNPFKRQAPDVIGILKEQNQQAAGQPTQAESLVKFIEKDLPLMEAGFPPLPEPVKTKTLEGLISEAVANPEEVYQPPAGSWGDQLLKEINRQLGSPESKLIVKERFYVTRETSYAQLEQAQALASKATRLLALADAYPALSANILSDSTITDKAQALKALADELSERVRQDEQAATKDQEPGTWGYLYAFDEGLYKGPVQ